MGAVNSWACSLFLNNLSVSLACLRSDRVTRLVLTNASSYRKHGKTTRIAVFCTVSSLRKRYTGRPSWKLGRHIQWLGGCMWDRTHGTNSLGPRPAQFNWERQNSRSLAFWSTATIRWFHFRSLEIFTPRILASETTSICVSLITVSLRSGVPFVPKKSSFLCTSSHSILELDRGSARGKDVDSRLDIANLTLAYCVRHDRVVHVLPYIKTRPQNIVLLL